MQLIEIVRLMELELGVNDRLRVLGSSRTAVGEDTVLEFITLLSLLQFAFASDVRKFTQRVKVFRSWKETLVVDTTSSLAS